MAALQDRRWGMLYQNRIVRGIQSIKPHYFPSRHSDPLNHKIRNFLLSRISRKGVCSKENVRILT